MKRNGFFQMDYRQVRQRVAAEKAALRRLVIETGIGMLLGILAAVFLGR